MSDSALQVRATSTRLPYDALHKLEVGESYCMARRFKLGEVTSEQLMATQEAMHNNARSAMRSISRSTGKTFTGETGDFRTTTGHNPVVCYLITRTA